MKKFLAILIALATVLSLCSCSANKGNDEESTKAGEAAQSQNADSNNSQGAEPEVYSDERVQKIGTNAHSSYDYKDYKTDKSGIVSLNGKYDSGAIYYEVELHTDGYFSARTKEYDNPENLENINSVNFIDANGKTLIEGYCKYSKVSDRFVVAAKTVDVVEGDDYDIFLHSGYFGLVADEGDIKYNADFYVFDLKTGKLVDGVVADHKDYIEVTGDFIKYKDKSGAYKMINVNGYDVPQNVSFINDGGETYYITDPYGDATVYDSNNKALFSYNRENDYYIADMTGGYFSASKTVGEEQKSFLVDKTGKIVSAEISSPAKSSKTLSVYGKAIQFHSFADGYKYQIYDFNGNVLAESENILSCTDNPKDNPPYYTFSSTKGDMIIVSPEGEVLFEVYGDEAYGVASSKGAYKTVGEDYYYFNLKDKDFTVKADRYANKSDYLVEVKVGENKVDLVDLATGETLISGYRYYDYTIIGSDIYVCAQNEDHTSDIYLIRF